MEGYPVPARVSLQTPDKSLLGAYQAALRGGFINRNYKVTYPDRTLNVVTYAETGDDGRYEQFLVMPAS